MKAFVVEEPNLPCVEQNAVGAYVKSLLDHPYLSRQIAYHRLQLGREAIFGECRQPWSAGVEKILKEKQIRLYSHQAKAMDYIRAGRSVIISTPTASGKSLIYNLPFHETFLHDPELKALYLFPLKALAQDQLASFQKLSSAWPKDARPSGALYDGDCPNWQRQKIRKDPPAALMTNPEMLHLSILAYHESWASFLANLAYIIVDEAHCYRGLFGSHMAQLFRRLNRICVNYGTEPTYIFCSATLGNPLELAQKLSGKDDIQLISESGAPNAARHFIFMDPEKSNSTCSIELLKRGLEQDLRSIVYCQSRRMTELINLWASSDAAEWKNSISAYRAGFLPEERRDIEKRMSSGDLKAVISTSALELGIDIGGLDLCILAGYPGTIMQTLQRGGRVGRAQRESAVIIVAGDDALDQYFVRNPQDFFEREPEKAVLNPENPFILERHLECAAAEFPLRADEEWLNEAQTQICLQKLESEGLIARSEDGMEWLATRKRPHGKVDLRGCGQSYTIEDQEGRIIGLIDASRVWKECHPGAIYIHHGKSYLADSLDDGRLRVLVKEAKVAWHTRVRSTKATEILELRERQDLGRCALLLCRLKITEKIKAYEKRANNGQKLLTVVPLNAPARIFETEGICYIFPDNIRRKLEDNFIHYMGSIHALEHAVIGLLPLEVVADRNDFGGISTPLHPQLGLSAVFIYDSMPGGAGLTEAAFRAGKKILEDTYKSVKGCPCEDGCPSCIQSPKCGAGNRPLSKSGMLKLLEEVLMPGSEGNEICTELKISQLAQPIKPVLAADKISTPVSSPQEIEAASLKEAPLHYVVFDVETRRSAAEVGGWDKADQMGVSVAVLYDSAVGRYFTYEQDKLNEMFQRMTAAELVVGFNNLAFDNLVLRPFWDEWRQILCLKDIYDLPVLDMHRFARRRLGYPVSLDNLATSTLHSKKSANGLKALKWWKEGKITEIATYCQKDVELTRLLYLYGLQYGHLFYKNKAHMLVKMPVDFQKQNGG